jgi:hypothetical protein
LARKIGKEEQEVAMSIYARVSNEGQALKINFRVYDGWRRKTSGRWFRNLLTKASLEPKDLA